MAAGWGDILQSVYEGDVQDWTFTIERYFADVEDAPESALPFDIEGETELSFGDEGQLGYGPTFVQWRMPFTILDESGEAYTALSQDSNEKAYRLRITDGSAHALWMYLRLTTRRRPVFTDIVFRRFSLYAFCGLELLERAAPVDMLDQQKTFHAITAEILHDGLHALPIQYIMGWRPANVAGTGAIMDQMRLRGWTSRTERQGFDDITPDQQLRDTADSFGCRVMQAFLRTSEGTPEWRFQHRYAIGEAIEEASRAAQRFDGSTIAENDLTAETAALEEADFINADEAEFATLDPVGSVEVLQDVQQAEAVNLLRDGLFQEYDSGFSYWEPSGPPSAGGVEQAFGGGAVLNEQERISQQIAWFAKGSQEEPLLRFDYEFPAGLHQARFEIEAQPFGGGGSWYQDEDGVWSTSSGYILTPESSSGQIAHTIKGPFPVDGKLVVTWYGGELGAGYDVTIKNASLVLRTQDASNARAWLSRFRHAETGEVAQVRRNWANIRDLASHPFEVYTGSAWKPATKWQDEKGAEYYDLAELQGQDRIDQQDEAAEILLATVWDIWPPHESRTFGGIEYIANAGTINLKTGTTAVVAAPKLKTFN